MVKKYYQRFAEQMLSEVANISEAISHAGEKGRNNEQILSDFLKRYLPQRFSVDTGQVVAADGSMSSQTDIIIHDRANTPALFLGGASVLVPIETTYAVISVKTALDKTELESAVSQIASVRRLKNEASFQYSRGVVTKIPAVEGSVLRPRGLVFAFKARWKEVATIESCFREVLEPIDDQYRANGRMCPRHMHDKTNSVQARNHGLQRGPLSPFLRLLASSDSDYAFLAGRSREVF